MAMTDGEMVDAAVASRAARGEMAPRQRPFTEADLGRTTLLPAYRADLRPRPARDMFVDARRVSDWGALTWREIGRPYRVERWAAEKTRWEREHDQALPPKMAWQLFNRSFQRLFDTDPVRARRAALDRMLHAGLRADPAAALAALEEVGLWSLWNLGHRTVDVVWDPRGKRALFEGLDLVKPEILFLGAADGYEAMQLLALYPGGHAVLVDYDDYCRTDRFGRFPEAYPFVGVDRATGAPRVWYRDEMAIDFEVADIRDLRYGREFDLVVSIGLLEHFPDAYKPLALEMHRRFLKPGGYAILTTPRLQWGSKLFYTAFADTMNFAYRELMDVTHLGLYAYENGFDIVRHGRIKAHNGIIARPR